MNVTLVKALVALVPASMMFSGSIALFFRERDRSLCSFLQLLGAGCLVVVVLAHVCEALQLFPWMHWGDQHSLGHYLDFWAAVFGLTLFPLGYLLDALTRRMTQNPHRSRPGAPICGDSVSSGASVMVELPGRILLPYAGSVCEERRG